MSGRDKYSCLHAVKMPGSTAASLCFSLSSPATCRIPSNHLSCCLPCTCRQYSFLDVCAYFSVGKFTTMSGSKFLYIGAIITDMCREAFLHMLQALGSVPSRQHQLLQTAQAEQQNFCTDKPYSNPACLYILCTVVHVRKSPTNDIGPGKVSFEVAKHRT